MLSDFLSVIENDLWLQSRKALVSYGKVHKASGFLIEAVGLKAKMGSLCRVALSPEKQIMAEVIGFKSEITYLMVGEELTGIAPGATVSEEDAFSQVPVGEGLLGRVINAQGKPLDNKGDLRDITWAHLQFENVNPLARASIREPLDVGVKAINGLFTLGKGQRVGLFSGSGVGKSVLLGMITQFCKAEVVVISLVGERGREVKEFIEENIGEEALKKTVVVASPADTSPLERIKAAEVATYIAEYFKKQNKQVLFLMDSITRYAHALRELGLALGEPPTSRGYPPSVFTKIPRLIERVGLGLPNAGSITGIYTVLIEGDDIHDPVADCARGILDGHIVLSRQLAEEGHYPAIDIESSISRVMDKVVEKEHLYLARSFKKSFTKQRKNADFMLLGAYQKGQDPEMDLILEKKTQMDFFLQQRENEPVDFENCKAQLKTFSCFLQINAVNENG